MSAIATIALKDWSEIHELGERRWLFRGHADARWLPSTSIERCFARAGINRRSRSRLELELIREFKRTYHTYADHVPGDERILEWYSLMQHHGAPTRLLDFTYSIYVAAFFALESASSDCAIWATNSDWIAEESEREMKRGGKSVRGIRKRTTEAHERIAEEALFTRPFVTTVCLLTPFRLNERLRIQKGTFLIPGNVALSFMENLQAVRGHGDKANLRRIVVPLKLRARALESLFYMNISSTSLFPGLDGYARSLGTYHPAFNR